MTCFYGLLYLFKIANIKLLALLILFFLDFVFAPLMFLVFQLSSKRVSSIIFGSISEIRVISKCYLKDELVLILSSDLPMISSSG